MAQVAAYSQRIWGAFNPATNQILGVQTSGEAPYQNIANMLITPTYAGVRTATNAATNIITTLGKTTQSDGGGATFVFNPSDTSSGCICTASSAGTVLTVIAISSGAVAVGQTLASSVTGAPLATILSFGTGLGGPGTYNLSGPVSGPLGTYLLDNNSSPLVSADGSRWAISNTVAVLTLINAPSGNPAVQIANTLYTLGNPIDNPSITMVGTGTFTVPKFSTPLVLAPSGQNAIALTTPAYTFGNPTDNPTYTFAGTGAASFGGSVSASALTVGGTALRVPVSKVKAADTGRTTIVPSNDPDLNYVIPGAGTYHVQVFINFYGNTTTNGGINCGLNYTGTFTAPGSVFGTVGNVNAAVTTLPGKNFLTTPGSTSVSFATVSATNPADWFTLEGYLIATGTGTLGFNWAQAAANGTSTVRLGSYLIVTQIA